MKTILLGGLAAGALTVLVCTSRAGGGFRKLAERIHPVLGYAVNCCFCTSWWISIAMLNEFTLKEWAATVAIANFTVLGIHMAISTVEVDE